MPEAARSGVALLEAIVAMTILALFSIALFGVVAAELRGADRAIHTLEATSLAELQLTRIKLLDREDLDHLPDSVARGVFEQPFEGYMWDSQARPVSGQPSLYEMSVRVTGHEVSRAVRTSVYRPPAVHR